MTDLLHYDALLARNTDVAESVVGDVDNVSEMADQLPLRGPEGEAAFGRVEAATRVEVGTTADGKVRLKATTPTALGDLQVDPATGRQRVYVGGAARLVALEYELPPLIGRMSAESSALAETRAVLVDAMPFNIEVYGVRYRPHEAVDTTTAPNLGTLNFQAVDASGATVGAQLSRNTIQDDPDGLGQIDALEAIDLSMSTMPVDAGQAFVVYTGKEGTGYQFPEGTFTIKWRRA